MKLGILGTGMIVREFLPWLAGPEAEQTGEFFTLCASPLAYRDQVRDSILAGRAGLPLYGAGTLQYPAQCAGGRRDVRTVRHSPAHHELF